MRVLSSIIRIPLIVITVFHHVYVALINIFVLTVSNPIITIHNVSHVILHANFVMEVLS